MASPFEAKSPGAVTPKSTKNSSGGSSNSRNRFFTNLRFRPKTFRTFFVP
jgi:hypothetical protein